MLRYFILIMIIFIPKNVLIAQNFPTNGNWKLQAIGSKQEMEIEINDSIWTINVNGNMLPQIITVDNEKRTIIVPFLAAISNYFYFEFNGDNIDLKAGGMFNIPLLGIILAGIENMKGTNDITDSFFEKIGLELEVAFYKFPIIRLYMN